MTLGWFTPKNVWIGLSGNLVLAALSWPGFLFHKPWTVLPLLASFLAAVLTSAVCARIAREYRRGSWMRISWTLLCASAGVSAVRYLMQSVFSAGPPELVYMLEWRQIPSVLSLVLLAAGFLAMYRSLASLGIGFSATRGDWALLLVIVAVAPAVVWFREGLSESRSTYSLIRYLQFISPVLVVALAGISVPLHRLSSQMEGGQIARSLRFFVLFALVRTLLFLRIIPAVASVPLALFVHSVLIYTIPWLFAVAVAYRWQLTTALEKRTAPVLAAEFISR
jgi:hypothetical protein